MRNVPDFTQFSAFLFKFISKMKINEAKKPISLCDFVNKKATKKEESSKSTIKNLL